MEKFSIGMDITDVVTAANMNEIASAVNLVNGVARRGNDGSFSLPVLRDGMIRVYFTDLDNLGNFSVVGLDDLYLTPENCESFEAEKITFSASAAGVNDKPVAILSTPANSGELAYAVKIGVTPARIDIKDLSHKFAKVSSSVRGVLESAAFGPVKILWAPASVGIGLGVVELGGSGESAPAAYAEYNSYFKIVDVSVTDEDGTVTNKVAVVDGGTFDGVVDPDKEMPWLINGEKFFLKEKTFEVLSSGYVYLEYNQDNDNFEVIFSIQEHPDFSTSKCYKHIGRVFLENTSLRIVQDFLSGGIPETIWITSNCNNKADGV